MTVIVSVSRLSEGLEISTFPHSSHLKGLSPLGPATAVSNGFIANRDKRIEQIKLHAQLKLKTTKSREFDYATVN